MSKVEVLEEFTKLRLVLVHRPGVEIQYDANKMNAHHRSYQQDIKYAELAKEHDAMVKALEREQVQVIYIENLLIELFAHSLNIKKAFIKEYVEEMVEERNDDIEYRLIEYLLGFNAPTLVRKVIEGVKYSELINNYNCRKTNYILTPLSNLMYIKDNVTVIGDEIIFHNVYNSRRKGEAILLKYIFKYNMRFQLQRPDVIYDKKYNGLFEGIDILQINKKNLLIILSKNSDEESVLSLASFILKSVRNEVDRVILTKVPNKRNFHYLDKVITQIDEKMYVIYQPIINQLELYSLKIKDNKLELNKVKKNLLQTIENIFKEKCFFINVGSDNIIDALKEQVTFAANVMPLSKDKVISFNKNVMTNMGIARENKKIIEVECDEFLKGNGGLRSLILPLYRKDYKR